MSTHLQQTVLLSVTQPISSDLYMSVIVTATMQFYQQSNSRERAGIVQHHRSTFGQLLRLSFHRSAVRSGA